MLVFNENSTNLCNIEALTFIFINSSLRLCFAVLCQKIGGKVSHFVRSHFLRNTLTKFRLPKIHKATKLLHKRNFETSNDTVII